MSDINDQPPPVANDRAAVWDLVIADMRDRDAVGRERYGTPLQPHNGRAALVDAYQEALDLVVYLRQRIAEDADHCAEIARLTAELAAARAVPADVEAAIVSLRLRAGSAACDPHSPGKDRHARDAEDHLRTAIARAITAARAETPSTVGGLLATAPVGTVRELLGSMPIVEWYAAPDWHQARIAQHRTGTVKGAEMRWRHENARTWSSWGQPWGSPGQHMDQPARFVPAHLADLDPATRGPLPGGEGVSR